MFTITDTGHETPCWLWDRGRTGEGYGAAIRDGRTVPAHKALWEDQNGAVPPGLELDHLCRVRHCVNPAHLEPVTHRENLMRSPIAPAAVNARKTHCPRDHPLAGDNLVTRTDGRRACKTCHRDREAARRSARKATV